MSSTRIVPELQQLAVGDFVPNGAPETGCGFVLDPRDGGESTATTPRPASGGGHG